MRPPPHGRDNTDAEPASTLPGVAVPLPVVTGG